MLNYYAYYLTGTVTHNARAKGRRDRCPLRCLGSRTRKHQGSPASTSHTKQAHTTLQEDLPRIIKLASQETWKVYREASDKGRNDIPSHQERQRQTPRTRINLLPLALLNVCLKLSEFLLLHRYRIGEEHLARQLVDLFQDLTCSWEEMRVRLSYRLSHFTWIYK